MTRLLLVVNLIATFALAIFVITSSKRESSPPGVTQRIVKVHRLEVVDDNGRPTAVIGYNDGENRPVYSLLSKSGERVLWMTIDSDDRPTLFFSSSPSGPVVSAGYLWGSDSLPAGETKDPLSSWGFRVRELGNMKSLDDFDFKHPEKQR